MMIQKMKINFLILLLIAIESISLVEQEKFTVSGTIKDKKTGETLIGASVQLKNFLTVGAVSNEYGFYSLQIPKEKAEMIFSTVHRCKRMEYDSIQLVNDFISEEKLEKLKEDKTTEEINTTKLNEEINLLYVAVTRTKNSIHIPETLMPSDFPKSPQNSLIESRECGRKETPKNHCNNT